MLSFELNVVWENESRVCEFQSRRAMTLTEKALYQEAFGDMGMNTTDESDDLVTL